MQWPDHESMQPFGYWFDELDLPELEIHATTELVLNLGAGERSLSMAKKLIDIWCDPEANQADVENAVAEAMRRGPLE